MKSYSSPIGIYFLPAVVLFVVACCVYGVTTSFEFLSTWDDKLYIVTNNAAQGFSKANLVTVFSSIYIGNYAPLHIVSYMADYTLWGLNPTGYHLTNVLLHASNGALLYAYLRRKGLSLWPAAAAAWIFLFHPAQVETVAWVSERKNLLAMLFFLGALIAYDGSTLTTRRRGLLYCVAFFLFLAGLLSKSIVVVFPVVMLLHHYCYENGQLDRLRAMKETLPFVVVALLFTAVTIYSQDGQFGGGRGEFHGGSPGATFITMVPVLMGYVLDCIAPFDLSPFYMVPIRQHWDGISLLSATAVLVIVFLLWRFVRRQDVTIFWGGIFFVFLAPVMQIIPLITLKNDRYLYFPLLGFAVVATLMAARGLAKYTGFRRRCIQGLLGCLVLMLPLLAYRQTLHWKNDVTLWSYATAVDSENMLAWRLLALGYTLRNDPANAFMAINRLGVLRNKYGFLPGYDNVSRRLLGQ